MMGIPNIGMGGLIVILILALIIFGPNRLPELGSAFGKTIREFKTATHDLLDDEKKDPSNKG